MKKTKLILTILGVLGFLSVAAFGAAYYIQQQQNIDPDGSKAAVMCTTDFECNGGVCRNGYCTPPAGTITKTTNTDSNKQYSFNASWTSTNGTRKIFLAKCSGINPGSECKTVSSTFSCPTNWGPSGSAPSITNSFCKFNVTGNNVVFTFDANNSNIQPGKYVVGINQEIPNGQSCSGNPTCTINDGQTNCGSALVSCHLTSDYVTFTVPDNNTSIGGTITKTTNTDSNKQYSFNASWTSTNGTRKIFLAKCSGINPGSECKTVSSTFSCPTNWGPSGSAPSITNSFCKFNVTGNNVVFTFDANNSNIQPGKYVVGINQEIPNGQSCSGNPTCTINDGQTDCGSALVSCHLTSDYVTFTVPDNNTSNPGPKTRNNCQGDHSICELTERCYTGVTPNRCSGTASEVCTVPTGKTAACVNLTIVNRTCGSTDRPDGTNCGTTGQICQAGICTNPSTTDYSKVKGIDLKVKLGKRTEKSGYTYPTVFVGVWRDSGTTPKMLTYKVTGLARNVEYKDTAFLSQNGTDTYTLTGEDYLIIKPESYLSKAYKIKALTITTNTIVLNDAGDYLAGDTIIDTGTFDSINVRDYVFFRDFFGRDKTYDYYYIDYNGNGSVTIHDAVEYRNNLGKAGATKDLNPLVINAIQTAMEGSLYKVIKL